MYYSGQIVHDLDDNKPIKCGNDPWAGRPAKRTQHYIDSEGIFLPTSIEHAQILLKEGRIVPAPIPYSHCCKCLNWNTNHLSNGGCYK